MILTPEMCSTNDDECRYNGAINLDPNDLTGAKGALDDLLRQMAADLNKRGLKEMSDAEYATAAATFMEAMTLLKHRGQGGRRDGPHPQLGPDDQDPELAVLRQRCLDLERSLKLKLEGDAFGSMWLEKFAKDEDSDRQDDNFDSAISKYNEIFGIDIEEEDRARAIPARDALIKIRWGDQARLTIILDLKKNKAESELKREEFGKCKKLVLLALSLAHETDSLWTVEAEQRGHWNLRPELLELLRIAELGLSGGSGGGTNGSGVDRYKEGLNALEAFDEALLLDPDNYELRMERDTAARMVAAEASKRTC